MAHINLLPWREELRAQRKKNFIMSVFLAAVLAAGVVGLVHMYFVERTDYQNARNTFIEQQITQLESKIKEIEALEREKERLLARMKAIETLQTSRPIIVRLFDELVTTMPEGVHLKEVIQKNDVVTVKGIARSNARVSNFMRNVEASEWVKNPELTIIETRNADGTRISNFTLTFKQVPVAEEDAGGVAQ